MGKSSIDAAEQSEVCLQMWLERSFERRSSSRSNCEPVLCIMSIPSFFPAEIIFCFDKIELQGLQSGDILGLIS
jgi:hypothetical protein